MKQKAKIVIAALALILLLATGGAVIGFRTGVLYFPPKADPAEAVAGFLNSVAAGDADSANAVLDNAVLILPDRSDPVQQLLADSYSWEAAGECTVEKYNAEQEITLTVMDLTALDSTLDEPLQALLTEQVQNNPKSTSYDSDGNYLPEVLDAAVQEALTEALSDPTVYYRTVTCTLFLEYRDAAWHISVPDEFTEALCGFAAVSCDVPAAVSAYLETLEQSVADSAPYIRKTYALETDCVLAPEPDPACYGTTTDPAVIQSVVDAASELLDGQSTVWTPDVQLTEGYEYNYYRDDTILVITWKEMIDGKSCTCAEVKIADPSQLMRKFVDDTYADGAMLYCSDLAEQTNAVFAANADFYYYRQMGIVVYQGVLYRCSMDYLDTCFFDYDGNMHFVPAGTFTSREEVEQYIEENNIDFSLAFGPTLIENGEFVYPSTYSIGQIGACYSRSAIGTVGELHYFFLTVNFDMMYNVTTATLAQLADFMMRKGCTDAYGLDGGQTSELYMNGTVLNHVDWGIERRVSDILAFGTAIPESER